MRGVLFGILLAVLTAAGRADELIVTKVATSPDGQKRLEAKMWLAPRATDPRVELTVTRGSETVFQRTIPPESEVRYFKLAWSPLSDSALVGLNQKGSEDLILLQLAGRTVTATSFDGGKLIIEPMLATLPFREDIKTHAPVARIPWKTLSWPSPGKCAATFIHDGTGYKGTAQIIIDYSGSTPRLNVVSIEPHVAADLWEQE